jgi:mono/diheme cytochrome c family protein
LQFPVPVARAASNTIHHPGENAPSVRPRLPFPRLSPPGPGYHPTVKANPYTQPEMLAWDALTKQYTASPGEQSANFTFSVTNISKQDVTINWVRPSCGCTVAKLPPTPWKLSPGESGKIEFTVDLRGKFGTLSKYVSVDTSSGQKMLSLRINVPSQAVNSGLGARTRNMQMALADRQAVFRKDCARCHATPTHGLTGEALFKAGCAICHESPHRATMVPDLHALKEQPTPAFWKQWIAHGKAATLMPAFAISEGGPLSDAQIDSLVTYLSENFHQNTNSATATVSLPLPPPH